MSSAVAMSNFYAGFSASPLSAADSGPSSYGGLGVEPLHPPGTTARRPVDEPLPTVVHSGIAAAARELDSRTSDEDDDVSVCSLDVTSSPATDAAMLIEAS